MAPQKEPVSPVIYILIAGALIVLLKLFVFDSGSPFQKEIYDALNEDEVAAQEEILEAPEEGQSSGFNLYDDIERGFLKVDVPMPERNSEDLPDVEQEKIYNLTPKPDTLPVDEAVGKDVEKPEEKTDYKAPLVDGDIRVAVVIDDMGVARHYSLLMMGLNPGLTLSFLPYAAKLDEITKEAQAKGFETMVHVPMEAIDQSLPLGPVGLRVDMEEESFKAALNEILDSFDGYDGINNHMGSLLTQDPKRMGWVMDVLKARNPDLFFLDSRTIADSIAMDEARKHGLPYAERHIFLDHVDDPKMIRMRLKLLEEGARHRGYAIAIGHPRKDTYEALEEWLPTLHDKGIKLVHVGELMRVPEGD